MGTYTSRGNFYKPAADGTENVNVVTDLNNNMDRLDALLGWRPVTSSTMPASAFQGAAVYATDTGKGYLNSASGASATWVQVPVAGATFDSGMTFNGSVVASGSFFRSYRAAASSGVFAGRIGTEVEDRFLVLADGKLQWGGGVTQDTNLYRSSADLLRTDDSFQVGANLTVSGSATLDDVIVGGNLIVNGATPRPQLHTLATAANTASETAIATLNIPAGDAVTGAVYRIRVYGTAAVTGTPTITLRCRIGGVSGTTLVAHASVTVRSGMTDGYWDAECMVTCASTGVSGTWAPMMKYTHNFVTSVTTYLTPGPITGAPVTRDTTISNDFVLTAQWSAASPSNTISCRGGEIRRVA